MSVTRSGIIVICLFILVGLPYVASTQTDNGIDPEALIERILTVEQRQGQQIDDVVFDAEYIEGEEKDGEFREKIRFIKKVYVKYFLDTSLFFEDYLEYYKDGQLKSEKDRDKEAKSRKEKKRKRGTKDISYSMLEPFYPEQRQHYEITYQGVTADEIEGYICHHFRVESIEEVDTRINGDYYFEADSFNLVRVDFSPAKLVKKAMFRLKQMAMTIIYGATEEGFWLPREFNIEGKGKAMFFFGVKFAGTEYYRNPIINGGINDELFEVENGD
ncbi:MAG: hypothetical protein JSU74_10960 [Candidatus Zixiibacteriota bacterium]|nr:MAG: hypothetical protein JSU74_10960 [candidate division Zixibacteria bacterium]